MSKDNNRKYDKINAPLLNLLVKRLYKSRAEFARKCELPYNQVGNWCNGASSPPREDLEIMAAELDVGPDMFYIPGVDLIQSGIEAALTKWALKHIENEDKGLSNYEASQFIRLTAPDIMEETEKEGRVEETSVPS